MKIQQNIFLPCLMAVSTAHADIRLSGAFSDNMVLQRGREVPVWGWAEPGEKVTARFAGQTRSAIAGDKGKWMLRFATLEVSSEPRSMTLTGRNTIVLKNVLVGDVWLCSGQSNMGRNVSRSWRPDDFSLDYPQIRWLGVGNTGKPYPVEEMTGSWTVCTPETTEKCCAVGFFFARRIFEQTKIPIGLIWSAWAGSIIREWIPRFGWRLVPELKSEADAIDAWYPNTKVGRTVWRRSLEAYEGWLAKAEESIKTGEPFPLQEPKMPQPPQQRGTTTFYNGKIHPVVPYALKGFLWYQGESDSRTQNYVELKKALVRSWRKLFADGDLIPFYYMQIQRSGDYCSPLVRDQQFKSLSIPNTGMAVLLDLDIDVHPQNKYDSGERLALWALAKDYGKEVVFSGPLYKGHKVEGNRMTIEFDHSGPGLMIGSKDKLNPAREVRGGKLRNIKISGKDKRWHPAESKIVGNQLEVWSEKVAEPAAVRYCYENIPKEPFLYNRAGLPAAQFKTDDWAR